MIVPGGARGGRAVGHRRSDEIGFACSGSLDYLQGGPFAFVAGLDAVGAWPPVRESHVEMDAAWALYEAWVAIQTGEVDSALDLRLRQVVARRPARDHDAADRPVLRRCRCGRRWSTWPRCRRARYLDASGRDRAATSPRSRPARSATRRRTRTRCARATSTADDAARAAGDARPAARRRHRADHRRRGRDRDRGRRPRPHGVRAAGVDPRHRAPHRGAQPRRARPHDVGVDARRRRGAPGSRNGDVDVAELHAQFSHEELILARGARARTATTAINPSGGRSPRTRS